MISEFSNDSWEQISRGKYPFAALGEEIVNAIVHRDYGDASGEVIINIYKSSIEIINSGEISGSFLKGKNTVRYLQAITALISFGAVFCSFYFNNIVDLLIQSYELSVSCLFVPTLIALFKRDGCFLAALLAVLFGALGFCLFRIISCEIPRELATLFLSFLGYCIGRVYALYQRKVDMT